MTTGGLKLDNDYALIVGTYTNLDVLAHQPYAPTAGKFPRHFSITPCGKAVIVANQDSSRLNIFQRDVDSGIISASCGEYEIPAPNYIRFI